MSLQIQLFGSFCVTINGNAIKRLGTKTGNRLFAFLALYHRLPGGVPAERSTLAELMWPETSHPRAMENLRQCISDMRAALGSEAERLISPGRNQLILDLRDVELDTERFDQLAATCSLEQIVLALNLYSAPLLNDVFDAWAAQERMRFQSIYVDLLARLASTALAEHRPATAIEPLKRAFAANSLDETIARTLMSAYAATGDYASAQRTYNRIRARLRNAINADPEPATASLAAELRKRERDDRKTANACQAPGNIIQGQLIGRLPDPRGPLFGRDNALLELRAAIDSNRMVTVRGTGGIGKTQLAIAAARSAWADYPDGVWFVDLSSRFDRTSDSASLAGEIFSTMSKAGEGSMQEAALCKALCAKSVLLVLDNCEQVTNCVRTLAGLLLRECPRVHLLATSRKRIGVDLESLYELGALRFPRPRAASTNGTLLSLFRPEQWTKYSAIALFQDRATQARRSFELTAETVTIVADICRLLGGIPLAIELVAPWVRSLTVRQIGRQLKSHLDLFVSADRDVTPRHRTLLAAVAWSYSLLEEEEQRFWQAVSIFADGFTLAAAHAVCAPDLTEQEVIRLVTALIDDSVLAYDGTGRYSLPETMRAFGLASSQTIGSAPAVNRHRHLNYFLALAEEAAPHLKGEQQAEMARELHAERANLRSACEFASELHKPEAALRIASAAWRMFYIRGAHAEGLDLLASALVIEGDAAPEVRARALADAGNLCYQMFLFERAENYFMESLAIYRDSNDKAGIARGLGSLSLIATENTKFDRARELLEECRAIYMELGNRNGEATSIGNLANNAAAQGDDTGALRYHEESLPIFRQSGDLYRVGLTLANITSIQHTLGQYEALLPLLRECLELCQKLENASVLAHALLTVMLTAQRLGRYDEAARLAGAHYAIRAEFELGLADDARAEQTGIVHDIIEQIGEAEYETRSIDGAAMSIGEIVNCALEILE